MMFTPTLTCRKRSGSPRPRARQQRGITLVETLVGLALGLFVVANGLVLLASHLHENKGLILEARLMQDLRAASSAVLRDLRRAGHWGDASAALWDPHAAVRSNPYQAVTQLLSPAEAVLLRYSRDVNENHAVDSNEEFGFRLRNQAIDTLLGGTWQTLTDVATVRITSFRLTAATSAVEQPALCERACPPAGPGVAICPPQLQVRHFVVDISAESPVDSTIKRKLQTSAKIRNDAIVGVCPP